LDLPRRDTAEASAYRARARDLGLPFLSHVRLGSRATPSPDDDIETGRAARTVADDLIIAPTDEAMPAVARWLRRYAAWRVRVALATPTAIRAGLREAASHGVLDEAVTRVERIDPIYSARKTFMPRQIAVLTLLVAVVAGAFVLRPGIAAALLWTGLAAFFFAVSFIRWTAALEVRACASPWAPAVADDAPIYTVLVPLRHEANMIGQILAGLDRLAWPRDRLDVKLVIDADDTQTSASRVPMPRKHPMRSSRCRRAGRGPSRWRSNTRSALRGARSSRSTMRKTARIRASSPKPMRRSEAPRRNSPASRPRS
jgi:hypothetical protein